MIYPSLFQKLCQYHTKGNYPFHMPGHKQGRGLEPIPFWEMDITEIPGFDSLHSPKGIIAQCQNRMAELYGTAGSFFLVNGSTCGILAALLYACGAGDKILVARNSHKSVFSGLVLSGAEPVYVYPEWTEFGFPGGISAAQIEKELKNHPDAKAVLITSPTYEGVLSDVQGIAEVVHQHGKLLIVDEAHGAHLPFFSAFPQSALALGGDIVIHSLHKTLPAPTQTAALHVGKHSAVSPERLGEALSMVQTTSPSYVLLGLIDRCMEQIAHQGEEMFAPVWEKIQRFRCRCKAFQRLELFDHSQVGTNHIWAVDESRLVCYSAFLSGENMYDRLLAQGLCLEMAGENHVTALCGVGEEEIGFQRLFEGLQELENNAPPQKQKATKGFLPRLASSLTPREAFFAKREKTLLSASVGKVSAGTIFIYPPGIPVVAQGEQFTKEVIGFLKEQQEERVTGLANGQVWTVCGREAKEWTGF